jgi:hypothetical protein
MLLFPIFLFDFYDYLSRCVCVCGSEGTQPIFTGRQLSWQLKTELCNEEFIYFFLKTI